MAHIVQLVPKQKLFLFPQQEKLANDLINLLSIFTESEAKIRPHFHLTGPSGSGKSYLLKQICEAMKVPMIEVNAAGINLERRVHWSHQIQFHANSEDEAVSMRDTVFELLLEKPKGGKQT